MFNHSLGPDERQIKESATGAIKQSADLAMFLLGRPKVIRQNVDVTRKIKYRKGFAVLGYLAINAGQWIRRERIAALIWPELEHEAALTNLRQVLSNLRTVINLPGEPEIIRGERFWVGLFQTDTCWIDACEASSMNLQAGASASPLMTELPNGDFLDGIEINGSEEFEDWLILTRQHLQNCLLALHEIRCRTLCRTQQNEAAIKDAHRMVRDHPFDEEATAILMTLLQDNGAHRAALGAFENLRERLGRDLNQMPGQALESLRQGLLRAEPD